MPLSLLDYVKDYAMQKTEVWKDCINFPKYQISNIGRLKNKKTGRIRKLTINSNGYLTTVCHFQDRYKHLKIHREMMATFKGKCQSGWVVDHINRIKTDNNLDNLRYSTYHESNSNRCIESRYGTGVSKNHKRYQAQIWIDKKRNYLGTFDTPQKAQRAYQKAIPKDK